MPSKRNKASRAAQLQPQTATQQSDYDTDTANLTDNQLPAASAVVPPPPPRSNTELNLLVLRRHYPDIEHILAIGPFAVLYTFTPDSQAWEKCDTQGTLFVCQLGGGATPYPRFRVVILNRKSLENFAYDLVSPEQVEVTAEYVIVQSTAADGSPQVYGIWIFADGEEGGDGGGLDTRALIGSVIVDCATRAEQYTTGELEPLHEQQYGTLRGEQEYTFEGATDAQAPYVEHEAPVQAQLQAQLQTQMPQISGRQIDLATLFSKPQAQGYASSPSYQATGGQPAQFMPNSDTQFFQGPPGPAAYRY